MLGIGVIPCVDTVHVKLCFGSNRLSCAMVTQNHPTSPEVKTKIWLVESATFVISKQHT